MQADVAALAQATSIVSGLFLLMVCALWAVRLRCCGVARAAAYLMCPLGQLGVVAAAGLLARSGLLDGAFALVTAVCGWACAGFDLVLVRALVAAEQVDLVGARVRVLREQVAAARLRARAVERWEQDDAATRAAIARRLEGLAAACEQGSYDAAALGDALARASAEGDRAWCANPALSALLELKSRACAAAGCALEARVLAPSRGPLPDTELCALVSELVDAAAAVAAPSADGGARVAFELRVAHGLVCAQVRCPSGQNEEASINGLRVAEMLAARYEGEVRCNVAAGMFEVSTVLNVAR